MTGCRSVFVRLTIFLLASWLLSARAQTVAYDSTTAPAVSGYSFNGAQTVNGNLIGNLNADDLNVDVSLAGLRISELKFVAYNFNSVAVTARPVFFLWRSDVAGTTPGAFIGEYALSATNFAPGSSTLLERSIQDFSAVIPSDGKLWAGVVFDDGVGTISVNAADLGGLGGSVVSAPIVGTSDSHLAVFQPPSFGPAGIDNPQVIAFGASGNPPVNFLWQVQVVPEPSTYGMLLAGLIGIGLAVRRRR